MQITNDNNALMQPPGRNLAIPTKKKASIQHNSPPHAFPFLALTILTFVSNPTFGFPASLAARVEELTIFFPGLLPPFFPAVEDLEAR